MINQRTYGNPPFRVAVLHGGPGAPGHVAPVARELSRNRGVIEPLQTAFSVDGQIRELRSVIQNYCKDPVTIIGHSWGAMLGYMFTGTFPHLVDKLILVGSGVFEDKYATSIMQTRLNRLNKEERDEVDDLMGKMNDPFLDNKDRILERFGYLIGQCDSWNPLQEKECVLQCNHRLHQLVWDDAQEIRSSGTLLEMGSTIACPVVAVHGDYDPHPSIGVELPLSGVLSDFRFVLIKNCGHTPWLEKDARDQFYQILEIELSEK